MDYSAANTSMWNLIIQLGVIAALLLVSNIIRKLPVVRKSLLPTAVLAGFLLLILRSLGIFQLDMALLDKLTYHGIAIGFIALALRIKEPGNTKDRAALKSGQLIVSTYLVQAIIGLIITLGLAYTFMPGFFKAAGVLLPMGYGQGPGQANNVGSTYEALGFVSGRSFGLSLAATGYLCACVVGVVYLNILARKGKIVRKNPKDISGSVTVEMFQHPDEAALSDSVDRLSVQMGLVLIVYLITYLITWGITSLFSAFLPGVASMVNPLLWGFNFIIGSVVATLTGMVLKKCRKKGIMNHRYQNNYLLSRISGFAFDLMIVCGIASIEINDLAGLWVPFLLLAVVGGAVTLFYLKWMCRKLYPDYSYEGFFSMYGMLTGTISSGVLLLREIDPDYHTPASNNLVSGSGTGIVFGVPVLVLVGLAPRCPGWY